MQAGHPPTLRARKPGFAHHGLKFSPFFDNRLAVASGANFGLIGNGRVHLLQIGPQGLMVEKYFDTQDCVYDVAWNETHENQVLAVCGNGALRLFDITLNGLPVAGWHEHTAEVVSADWGNLDKALFATASWDGTGKVWSLERATSLATLQGGPGQMYAALFSPHQAGMVATAGQDGTVRLWDIRTASAAPNANPQMSFRGAPGDILAADWNKYHHGILATAGKDGTIRVWDVRNPLRPTAELPGHALAVRKIQWSPHHADIIASAGYDMTARVWHTRPPAPRRVMNAHSEFTMALGWALFEENVLATAAWDSEIHVYRPAF